MRAALSQRLASVRQHLTLAAHHAGEDVEHVHDLRVSARRGLTMVRIAGALLRRKDRRRLRRMLRQVRRAAGDARDLDVLLLEHEVASAETLGLGERALLVEARERRAAAQAPIVATHEQLAADERWADRERRILGRVERRGRGIPARSWALERVGEVFDRFVEATPVDLRDSAAMHRYRLRAKDLRYTLDELAPALPRRFVRDLEPIVAELQRRLGDAHDHAALSARFREWAVASTDPVLAAHLASLAEREADALSNRIDELAEWWDPPTEARFLTACAAGLERAKAR